MSVLSDSRDFLETPDNKGAPVESFSLQDEAFKINHMAFLEGMGQDRPQTSQEPAAEANWPLLPQAVDFGPPEFKLDIAGQNKAQDAAAAVTYHWHIPTDRISWSGNAPSLLGVSPDCISTGKAFASLLDNQNFTSRYDAVMRTKAIDAGEGVSFEIEYMLRPGGRDSNETMWAEDTGKWFADARGYPTDVYGIMRKANERHTRDQHMNFLSNCDPLTGMMNRNRMQDALGEAITVAVSEKSPGAFAILAINNLDVMNEAYGFEVADEVVVALGQRLRHVMRLGDGIARYSGSKFGIILNSCRPEELIFALERFMRAVRDSVIETRHGPVWALLSIGAVSLPALGDTAAKAIAHAEEALSESFRLPSDGYVVYTSSEERKTQRLLNARCATEIVECLQNGVFKLAYQPIYDATTGDVILHEALLRMADNTGAMITAGHLVPIAERLGLIRLIDRAVLQLALSTLQVYPEARLSVNISATTANDPRWNIQLIDMIAAASELAPRLVIELTETSKLGDLDTSHTFLTALQRHGCGVALDDFGAGYTSYRNLTQLPLTMIKLDGSFCVDITQKTDNQIFVKSMVDLARSFGLKLVAEWVENESDAEMLRTLGVDYLQGNYFGEASVEAPWAAQVHRSFAIENGAATTNNIAPSTFMGGQSEAAPETNPAFAPADEVSPAMAEFEHVPTEIVDMPTTDQPAEPATLDVAMPSQVASAAQPDIDDWSLQTATDESLGLLNSILAEFSAALNPSGQQPEAVKLAS